MEQDEKAPEAQEAPVEETPSQNVQVEESTPVKEVESNPTAELEAKNRQLYERAKKAEADAKEAKLEAERLRKGGDSTKSLEVDDFINISASLEGLDKREKEYLAEQHKLSGRPLIEIRTDENFLLWQEAYRAKAEKERALKPSGTQPDGERPTTLSSKIKELNQGVPNYRANLVEQEKLLEQAGLWKNPKRRSDRTDIA